MCGIFAVLREPCDREPPSAEFIEQAVGRAVASSNRSMTADPVAAFEGIVGDLAQVNVALKGTPGVRALLANPELIETIEQQIADIEGSVASVEADLDAGRLAEDVPLESLNQALVAVKDMTWAITRDRVRTARGVAGLAGTQHVSLSAVEIYTSIQLALSAIDRLEVRGRDSAGISVLVHGHGMATDEIDRRIADRQDPLFLSGAVHRSGDTVVFVYKAAAEIGALGDNVSSMRIAIEDDAFLRELASREGAEALILSHTRWASVGTVSEPNAHPIDSQETEGAATPYVIAALNGDVDNYAELKARERLHVAEEITTDAKVIPVMVGRRLAAGHDPVDSFRETVDQFDGSVAIAAAAASNPTQLLLAVRGSGQGCYVGFAENAFLVASEPYGVAEECSTYLRVDGEVPDPKSGKNGQVFELRREGAGTMAGLRRISYSGEELPVNESELTESEVTTRDIDRGGAPHFLLKEITESPQSVRRTLRGKVVEQNGRLHVTLRNEALPDAVRASLASGAIKQVIAIGQGTASVASRSLVTALEAVAPAAIAATARPATELSGFGLRDDMSDTLVVAVSQSGTTTDTNRTVDMVRARGAKVIAIVNRRQSDLTEKSDGVLYTSDGRDVEMSVASTKAFYAQVTACTLLAIAIADELGATDKQQAHALIAALRELPDAMLKVLERRPEIASAAQQFAPHRRSWAIVGNGPNHIAAQELRIKLSELCYKSIAFDVTEDKKHIDLSAEPMILVCAAGLSGSNASDVAKEVAIYRAHKAAAIVIASEGASFDAAAATVFVPQLHPTIDFILSTMAGHIFGYEAALAIDAQGKLMRAARAILDDAIAVEGEDEEVVFAGVRGALAAPTAAIFDELRSGALNGHLEPSTAVRLASLLRYATGVLPIDSLEVEMGRPTSPLQLIADLIAVLTRAVDELTRPIDAVKHQAKTVTVGISRTEDTFADNRLVNEVLKAGALRDRLSYRSMRTLAALDPAVVEIVGFTRYQVDGEVTDGNAMIRVVDKGGVAQGISSRSETDPRLTGTKHRAAYERQVTVGRGQRDGRSVVIVPESKDQQVTGITLLHAQFKESLPAAEARAVLTGYRNRYSAIVDAVTETEPDFDDTVLERIPFIDLLVDPVWILAQHWRESKN